MKWGDGGFIGVQDGRLLVNYRPSIERELVVMHLKVKRVLRSDPITIRIYSGFWSHRWIMLTFDTREGADKAEPELLKIVSK